jgi:S-formylglutathione hydrolase FrmB
MASFSGCIRSKEMAMDTWVQVIAPDGTKKTDQPSKVIYLLHGTTGNSMNWVHLTLMPLYAIEHRVVFVVPEVGNTWFRNIPGRGNFFNYIVDELPEIIVGMFRISDKREDVAVMGNSSGAYAAMKCALLRPEQYWLCGAFSTASVHLGQYLDYLRRQKPEEMENPLLRSVYGPNLECSEDDELLTLAQKASEKAVKPKIYMTIGLQDFLYEPNEVFRKEMQSLPLDFTYETWEGGHEWRFWDRSLKSALEKYYPIEK